MSAQEPRGPRPILVRARLLGSGALGGRDEQDWLAAVSSEWRASPLIFARGGLAEARWSDSDPSLASLARAAMGPGCETPWLLEWVASEADLIRAGELRDGQRALDWLAERALSIERPEACERLPGRWSDRLLERARGGADWELEAWGALRSRWEREELSAAALSRRLPWDGVERRSKERGGL